MTRIAMTRIALVVFILVSTIFGGACEKRPDPCDTLTARICEGKNHGYCIRARAVLDRELTGPGGRVLKGRSRSEGCRLILADHQVLGAYAREVARRIK